MTRAYFLNWEGFSTISEFYTYINAGLFHCDYFGNNLDALADCLRDIEIGIFIWENSEKSHEELAEFETICEIIEINHTLTLR